MKRKNGKKKKWLRYGGFLGIVSGLYLGLFLLKPAKTASALENSAGILREIALPLILVFCAMVLMNRFLQAEKLTKYLGRETGIRGLLLSAAAGIISVGPIYAWYPLLKTLRERGASYAILATFLCNRSIKPFLIPVMISYFGWRYVIVLTGLTAAGSMVVGVCVGFLTEKKASPSPPSGTASFPPSKSL